MIRDPEPHKSTSGDTIKALKAELAEARAQIAALTKIIEMNGLERWLAAPTQEKT